jgi:2-amino-4-hydroxy-6-hydroxymethyldihydropteridine diphosphokinase
MLNFGLIALGANLPSGGNPPIATVGRAIDFISSNNVLEVARSDLFSTPAFPDPTAPPYINACVSVQTTLSATALLAHLNAIEDTLGRVRGARWGARVIDLDLLSYGASVLPDRQTHDVWAGLSAKDQMAQTPDRLILPHPRIADRAFVLVPLAQIAPRWRHPITGLSALDMLERRPKAEIEAIQPVNNAVSGCQV